MAASLKKEIRKTGCLRRSVYMQTYVAGRVRRAELPIARMREIARSPPQRGPSLTPVEKNLGGQTGGAPWRGAKRT
jgi:hypothetical protein